MTQPRFDATWDRFDICTAWYAFAAECHGGQDTEVYRILGRLHDMEFRIGHGQGRWSTLSDNEKAIYANCWLRFYPGTEAPEDIKDWARAEFVPEFLKELTVRGFLEGW